MKTNKGYLHKTLIIFLISIFIIPKTVLGEVSSITDVEDKINGISKEEKEALDKLFSMEQEITGTQKEKSDISKELKQLRQSYNILSQQITQMQEDYDSQLSVLQQVLIGYEREGPVSYINTLLRSGDLKTFVRSVNMLRDLTGNVDHLLNTLEDKKETLKQKRKEQSEQLGILNEKQEELVQELIQLTTLKEEQETYLVTLKGERDKYQQKLDEVISTWESVKGFFGGFVIEFTKAMNSGDITLDDLSLSYNFITLSGNITEDRLNAVMKDNIDADIQFHFHENEVVLMIPELFLTLQGKFIISGDTGLLFEPTNGTFYDLPLEMSSIDELFKDSPLLLDFKELMGKSINMNFNLKKVELNEGVLKFDVVPVF